MYTGGSTVESGAPSATADETGPVHNRSRGECILTPMQCTARASTYNQESNMYPFNNDFHNNFAFVTVMCGRVTKCVFV